MNKEQINADLVEIIKKKNELAATSYDNENYDAIEEEVHQLEDNFMDKHGDVLTDLLQDVHDEYCPDDDVLLPTAYVANQYTENGENGSTAYDVSVNDGVLVEVDDFKDGEGRLVFLPNPLRVILNMPSERVAVWN